MIGRGPFLLQSADINTLYDNAHRLGDRLSTLPELQDLTSDLLVANPEVKVDLDRAASLGVTAAQIESALYDAYGSRQVYTIYTPTTNTR